MNEVLNVIKERRSIRNFQSTPVDDEKIKAIVSAGQWAPSFLNLQPWKFIIVKDEALKKSIAQVLKLPLTATEYRGTKGFEFIPQAPVIIVTCVNPKKDQVHHAEDGAIATQNMALAAQSLGLGSCWIGVLNHGYIEDEIKKTLEVPDEFRIISLLPIGVPGEHITKTREELEDIVFHEKFDSR